MNKPALSLIELLISVSLMLIMMAVTIPVFNNYASSKNLTVQAQGVLSNVQLVRQKALSAAVIDTSDTTKKYHWGIKCLNVSAKNQYALGYVDSDALSTFVSTEVITLDADNTIRCRAPATNPDYGGMYFNRITGSASLVGGASISSVAYKVEIANSKSGTSVQIQVYGNGQIKMVPL